MNIVQPPYVKKGIEVQRSNTQVYQTVKNRIDKHCARIYNTLYCHFAEKQIGNVIYHQLLWSKTYIIHGNQRFSSVS